MIRPTSVPERILRPLMVIVLMLATVVIVSCGGGDSEVTTPTGGDGATEEDFFDSARLLDGALQVFADAAENATGQPVPDSYAALDAAATWLEGQPGVDGVALDDSSYLHIDFASGLYQLLYLDFKREDGTSLNRGGGGGTGAMATFPAKTGDCDGVLDNSRILFYTAVTSDFGINLADQLAVKEQMEAAQLGLEVTIMRDSQCTPDLFASFGQYGLVFIDSHGSRNGTLTGSSIHVPDGAESVGLSTFLALAREQVGVANVDRLLRGDLFLGRSIPVNLDSSEWFGGLEGFQPGEYEIWVSSSFVRHMGSLAGTIVFNGSCFSGMTSPTDEYPDPIGAAYLSRSPLAYYGWTRDDGSSRTVDSRVCEEAKQNYIDNMLDGYCTGEASRREDGTVFVSIPRPRKFGSFLKIYGDSTSHYEGLCDLEEFTDSRDNQVYATACIDGKVWMAENLRWSGAGVSFNNATANDATMGRMYTGQEVSGGQSTAGGNSVQGICPQGWHVPSRDEVLALIEAAGGSGGGRHLASRTAWPSYTSPTDALGFHMVPTGYGIIDDFAQDENDEVGQEWFSPTYPNIIGQSFFWTGERSSFNGQPAGYMYFLSTVVSENSGFYLGISSDLEGIDDPGAETQLPCRCVKDDPE